MFERMRRSRSESNTASWKHLAEILVGDSVETRASLLIRIRDTDDALAWNQFFEIYAPLVHRFGC